jgi:hypothetical protein
MLSMFINQGAIICLVSYPMSKEYLEIANQFPEYLSAQSYFQTLAESRKIKYINLSSWKYNDMTLFANADHVNIKGAKLLTEKILDECN